MSVSFYGYVQNGNCFAMPEEISKRISDSFMPDHGTREWMDWYYGEGDQSRFANPDYDSRVTVNLNQRNARYVLNELGFFPDADGELCGVMSLDVFIIGVKETIRRLRGEPEPGLTGHVNKAPGKVTIVNCGTWDGYLNDRLANLLTFAEAVKEYGATHIGWG